MERLIGEVVGRYIAPDGPGLSVLVGRDQRVLFKKGYGLADVGRGLPVRPDTRFIIASVSKQFTAMSVMILKHRGLLNYDEPIARFFPDFPDYKDRVTIRQLMTHTSGVPEYLDERFYEEVKAGRIRSLDSFLDLIKARGGLEFEPGTRWRYCNSAYLMLGAITERISGQPYAEFMKANVFDKLGMTSTLVGVSEERPDREAIGYTYKSKTEFEPAEYSFPATIGYGDGNIISTTEDLFLWGQALYTDRILPLEVLAEAFVPVRPFDPSFSRYGFGHHISERRGVREVHHSGSIGGYNSKFTRFTDEKLSIILLTNAAGVNLAEIAGVIAEGYLGDKMAPITEASLCPAEITEKIGVYSGRPRGGLTAVQIEPAAAPNRLLATSRSGDRIDSRSELIPLSRDLFHQNDHTDTYFHFLREDGAIRGLRQSTSGRVTNLTKE